jgi:hypothetical protein
MSSLFDFHELGAPSLRLAEKGTPIVVVVISVRSKPHGCDGFRKLDDTVYAFVELKELPIPTWVQREEPKPMHSTPLPKVEINHAVVELLGHAVADDIRTTPRAWEQDDPDSETEADVRTVPLRPLRDFVDITVDGGFGPVCHLRPNTHAPLNAVSRFDVELSQMRMDQMVCFYPFADNTEFPRIVGACQVLLDFSSAEVRAGAPHFYGLGRLEEVQVIVMSEVLSLVADRNLDILWISKTSPFAFLSAKRF